MTTFAESRRAGGASWRRELMLVAGLGLLAWSMPLPWGLLWLAVPVAVALALTLSWRWGAWGVMVPVVLLAAIALTIGPHPTWGWWIPAAALCGVWMGLREEGGGPSTGERAWMLFPLLLLAAGLPWTAGYGGLVQGVEQALHQSDAQTLDLARGMGYRGERLAGVERLVTENAALRHRALPNVVPSAFFVWMAALSLAGRGLSGRIAARLSWPELSRIRIVDWRLPDAAIWFTIVGLALLVAGGTAWAATAWTLLAVTALGFCVQGIAVVESLLLARGVSPSIVVLTLLFVLIMALPVFALSTVLVGVSDVWLDYRRLESDRDGGTV